MATDPVNLHDVNCPGCGAPMDGHLCPSSSGPGVTLTKIEYVRGTGPRKVATAHPTCPHCGGRIHFNMSGTAINAECLWRQFLVANGRVGPKDKLPEMYLSNMLEMAEWYEAEIKLGKSVSYGKFGGGTYSTRRKTPVPPAGTPPTFPPGTSAPAGPPASATMPPPSVGIPPASALRPNKEEETSAPPPKKKATKDELRAKRRELLKARNKK